MKAHYCVLKDPGNDEDIIRVEDSEKHLVSTQELVEVISNFVKLHPDSEFDEYGPELALSSTQNGMTYQLIFIRERG